MKQEILDVIQSHPKHYTRIIKNNPSMWDWVLSNQTDDTLSVVEMIYVAISESSPLCELGNKRVFNSINLGWRQFCGDKSSCECNRANQSAKMTKIQATRTYSDKKDIVRKMQATNLEKYGCQNVANAKDVREKTRKTNIERYGTATPLQSDVVREKVKRRTLEIHGVEFPLQSTEIRKKSEITTLRRYNGLMTHARKKAYDIFGGNPFEAELVKNKIRETNFERYGAEQISHSHLSPETVSVISNPDKFKDFIREKTAAEIANYLGIHQATVYKIANKFGLGDEYVRLFNTSQMEKEVCDFLTMNEISYIQHDRDILDGKEIDIYIPAYNLAIEINGLYWHSEISGKRGKWYHHSKWKGCNNKGITLVHIFSDDWSRKEFWFNKILYLCGRSANEKIYARKCHVVEVSATDTSEFLNTHHYQGSSSAQKYTYGLVNDGKLVSMMTFSNTRDNKKSSILLARFCNHTDYLVVGAASKLLSHFVNHHKDEYDDIISFSDNGYSDGRIYETLGFEKDRELTPDYQYVVGGERFHKSNFKKSILKKRYGLDSGTEWEMMQSMGNDRIWDSGKIRWKLNIK